MFSLIIEEKWNEINTFVVWSIDVVIDELNFDSFTCSFILFRSSISDRDFFLREFICSLEFFFLVFSFVLSGWICFVGFFCFKINMNKKNLQMEIWNFHRYFTSGNVKKNESAIDLSSRRSVFVFIIDEIELIDIDDWWSFSVRIGGLIIGLISFELGFIWLPNRGKEDVRNVKLTFF